MTIQLGGLEWAAQLVGARFPDADEDALWRCARAWHLAAEQLRSVHPAAAEIGSQIADAMVGETAERFAEIWGTVGAVDGPIVRLATACDAVATGCDRAAAEVEQAKLVILAELAVLAATVAAFAMPALWLVGGPAIAQAIVAARLAILFVLERLMRVVGGPMAALLDLDALVAQVRTMLGHLAWARLDSPLNGGAGDISQPDGLFAPLPSLPGDLPASFGAARDLLLAGLSPGEVVGPQGTMLPPSAPDITNGPVPPAPAPPGGSITRPLPFPSAPVLPAPPPSPPLPPPPSPLPPPALPQPPQVPPHAGSPGPPAPPPTRPATPPPPGGGPNPPASPPPPLAPRAPGPPTPAIPLPPPTPGPLPLPTTAPAPSPGSPAPAVSSPPPPPPAGPGLAGPGAVAVVVGLSGVRARLTPAGPSGPAGGKDDGPARPASPVELTGAEALAYARACLFATDAGYGFYPPGDENRDLARAVRASPGQVALDLIGDTGGFTIDSGRLSPAQFALVLRELIGTGELTVRPNQAVRLLCGASGTHAAVIAAELGREVLAPDGPLWTSCDGEAIVATACLVEGVLVPVDPPDGQWCCFGGHGLGGAGNTSVS